MVNKYQKQFLVQHHLTLANDPQEIVLKELYQVVPSLDHPYRVFGAFKKKVLVAIKGKHFEAVNKKHISYLKSMILPNRESDISSHVRALGLGFIDSIVLSRETKSPYLLEQLLWRAFYYQADVDDKDLQRSIWKVNHRAQEKFFKGKTGFPLIDASVNCLVHTGKLPNKLRMLLATFFCKNMIQPWMDGEKFFSKYLEDYDRVVNRGNWIWCSQLRYDNQQFVRFLHPYRQLKILLKTEEGKLWYSKWKKTEEYPEMLNWEESCKAYRDWKKTIKKKQ